MAKSRRGDADKKRYEPLGDYLRSLDAEVSEVTLSFTDVEEIIGRELPPSATRHHHQWWANQTHGSRAYHWQDAGFQVANVDLPGRRVRFHRVATSADVILENPELQDVVSAVNEHARARPIGELQNWRKNHFSLARSPSRTIFYSGVEEERSWAFHVGGLSELQFNIGFEDVGDSYKFRHGVAFSLQPTREVPDIEPLIPKIERFNEYLRIYPDAFEGYSMWHWRKGVRSTTHAISQIPDELVQPDTFIFTGALQPGESVSIGWILDDFDRLLSLYKYVEGLDAFPKRERAKKGFRWTPGNNARVSRTSYQRTARSIDKSLRHNVLQDALFRHLEETHKTENTSGEQDCGNGTPIDIAVRNGNSFTYYEIKTGLSAQSCIREALGQLMEYSFWPGAQEADRLIIVGEADFDKDAKAYLRRLRTDFLLPIEYQQFDMESRRLV